MCKRLRGWAKIERGVGERKVTHLALAPLILQPKLCLAFRPFAARSARCLRLSVAFLLPIPSPSLFRFLYVSAAFVLLLSSVCCFCHKKWHNGSCCPPSRATSSCSRSRIQTFYLSPSEATDRFRYRYIWATKWLSEMLLIYMPRKNAAHTHTHVHARTVAAINSCT